MATKFSSHFVKSNPHPLGNGKIGDCVIRALSHATGKTWLQVYDELCEIGRRIYCPMVWRDSYDEFLTKNGFVWHPVKREKGVKALTVKTFAEKFANGVYVLRLASHLTCVKDGYWYDTWNCFNCSVYGYYELTNK